MSRSRKILLLLLSLIVIFYSPYWIHEQGFFSKNIYTPKTTITLIDAKTKKPIKDAYIKVTWHMTFFEHRFWGEVSEAYPKVLKFTSNKDGKVVIPAQKRSAFFNNYGKSSKNILLISIFAHRYISRGIGVDGRNGSPLFPTHFKEKLTIKLEPVKYNADGTTKIKRFDRDKLIEQWTSDAGIATDWQGVDFMIEDLRLWLSKFPNGKYALYARKDLERFIRQKKERNKE